MLRSNKLCKMAIERKLFVVVFTSPTSLYI